MGREYTTEEVRDQFLAHVGALIGYWERETTAKTARERLEGLAYSICSLLDGEAADLPRFIVAPSPHRDDKQYCINNGENYFPENDEGKHQVKGDIAGCLHELLTAE